MFHVTPSSVIFGKCKTRVVSDVWEKGPLCASMNSKIMDTSRHLIGRLKRSWPVGYGKIWCLTKCLTSRYMRNIYRDNRRTSWYDGIPNVPNNDTQLQLLHGRCTFGDFFVEHPENSGIPQIHVYLLESRWLDAPMYWLMLSHLLSLPCKWKKSARQKKKLSAFMAPVCFFCCGKCWLSVDGDILHSGILATEKDEQNCGNKNRWY